MYSEFSFIILKLALTNSLQFEGPLPEAVYSTHDTSRIEITQKKCRNAKSEILFRSNTSRGI